MPRISLDFQDSCSGLGGAVGIAAGGATGNTGTGTIAGAATGLNIDANNRQLHPTETQWIKANAKRYADKKGISEADAGKQLSPIDPAFANSGPGYMFYATPAQKANSEMYAKQPAELGIIGTASAVKAVRSADEVNAAMKVKG